ncbi:hypothetical protein Rsub_03904 [Raphidocelis subcapitata]|uniref:Uncharacterized protein n=1 Tax=Raphidocelis subcapitata TaxID=307507 RepID=A0A2V0NTQ1_9CHLO|nr:hypothetical protein Rsub_03904 [Raphidocelis subcapitata]|eukprot:GBF91048.1 hypothetical protein Rsub_03904 [Raphidocelis subcapitata]
MLAPLRGLAPRSARSAAAATSARSAPLPRPRRAAPRRAPWRCAASEGDADAAPAALSLEDARGMLGVGAAATFDDILSAKNRKLSGADEDGRMQIEAAYDVLFMHSMKKRITGELQVPSGVRYADVPQAKKRGGGSSGSGTRGGASQQPALLQKLPGGVGVATPRAASAAALQAAVFGGLVAWALAGALLESPEAQAADTAGLQLALAAAFAVYQLRDAKRLSIGRAAGITVGSMVAGIMFGALLNAWLQVDVVPIGSFSSPGVFVTEWAIVAVAAGCFFLA